MKEPMKSSMDLGPAGSELEVADVGRPAERFAGVDADGGKSRAAEELSRKGAFRVPGESE